MFMFSIMQLSDIFSSQGIKEIRGGEMKDCLKVYLGLDQFCRKGRTGGWHTPANPVYDLKSYDYV